MSYTPTTWQAGDTVTAGKLNNMETGIDNAANPFFVKITPTDPVDFSGNTNKTANEITAALAGGREVFFEVVGFPGFDQVIIPAAWYTLATGHELYAACATLVDVNSGVQIIIVTSDADNTATYGTFIYVLTPAS